MGRSGSRNDVRGRVREGVPRGGVEDALGVLQAFLSVQFRKVEKFHQIYFHCSGN
ncbi:putative beta-D-xylosidase 6 [Iris pallida]|uniref:Beta-D-xylosidase 6 n=1 Tax=Iris pallida TaxID=29817 RepID=A0AAX6H879_IRIPA|nr:putative beta-D-xylosidase 6 [Iris pallida]